MGKLLLLLAVTVLVAACGRPPLPVYQIETEFQPFVIEFEQAYNVKVNVGIVFNDSLAKDQGISGVCHSYNTNNIHNWIEIDTNYWNYSNYYGKQQLIYHELGHCVLGLQHDNRLGTIGIYTNIPLSIMYYRSMGNNIYYSIYNEYYITHLGDNYGL